MAKFWNELRVMSYIWLAFALLGWVINWPDWFFTTAILASVVYQMGATLLGEMRKEFAEVKPYVRS